MMTKVIKPLREEEITWMEKQIESNHHPDDYAIEAAIVTIRELQSKNSKLFQKAQQRVKELEEALTVAHKELYSVKKVFMNAVNINLKDDFISESGCKLIAHWIEKTIAKCDAAISHPKESQ